MPPFPIHGVPEDELYVGNDGVQRPYGMQYGYVYLRSWMIFLTLEVPTVRSLLDLEGLLQKQDLSENQQEDQGRSLAHRR